ncbi:MAG: nucleotide exchange factor GrpE [Synergistaceae bacterium]|nr:nucleotide exchange factor GrpE [Synergistaceae bacterium]
MISADDKEPRAPEGETELEETAPAGGNEGDVREGGPGGADAREALLEEARLEAARFRDEAARAKADFYNYRARVERDRARDRALAAENAVLELLPVLDNFERALEAESDKSSSMYKGVSMVQRQFFGVLQNLGLVIIDAAGAFDPSLHEALMTVDVESGEDDGRVMEVMDKGYMLGDKVLRAARVKVGRKKSEYEAEK